MSDINFRIKTLRDHFAKGNNSDFASMIESSEANIRNYIKETEPRASILVSICEKLEVNAEWLLLGRGEMIISKTLFNNQEQNIHFSKEGISPEVINLFEEYKKAFNAIQVIQDRKIEVLNNSIETLALEIDELKSTVKTN